MVPVCLSPYSAEVGSDTVVTVVSRSKRKERTKQQRKQLTGRKRQRKGMRPRLLKQKRPQQQQMHRWLKLRPPELKLRKKRLPRMLPSRTGWLLSKPRPNR